MAEPHVQLSKPSGLYTSPQTLNWVLSSDVARFAFTVNGAQPVLSQYIAYDTLVPPNPFIAVTQDGRGNVVYDGGFPKFYNIEAPPQGAGFYQLPAACKFLYNAILFCANPVKVAAGNRKVLILGDTAMSEQGMFRVKGTSQHDFYITLARTFAAVGFTGTIKDRSDYGGEIDARYAELDQYALVLVMSSRNNMLPYITNQSVTDIVAYREAGNGVIVITDHWPFFVGTANKLVANFGAQFLGEYNRVPVNVGYLRSTYGDHPLYNGMSNSEYIHAGHTESRIEVTQYPFYTSANAPAVPMNSNGRYIVSILAILKNGQAVTYRYVYNIVIGEFVWWRDENNVKLGAEYETRLPINDFYPYIENPNLGTLMGYITRNGKRLGSFTYVNGSSVNIRWLSGDDNFPVSDQDVFNIQFYQPFNYNKTIKINRFQPEIQNVIDYAHSVKLLAVGDFANVPRKKVTRAVLDSIKDLYPEIQVDGIGNHARDMAIIRRHAAEYVGPDTTAYIYPTKEEAASARQTLTTQPDCIIDAETKQVWVYENLRWVVIAGLAPMDFLGAPRKVTGITNGISFLLKQNGAIEIIQP